MKTNFVFWSLVILFALVARSLLAWGPVYYGPYYEPVRVFRPAPIVVRPLRSEVTFYGYPRPVPYWRYDYRPLVPVVERHDIFYPELFW